MPTRTLRLAILLVSLLLTTPSLAEGAIECGTPGWAPFRDALVSHCRGAKGKRKAPCEFLVQSFTTCKRPNIDEPPEPIDDKQVASGKVLYCATEPEYSHCVRFSKTGKGWTASNVKSSHGH